MSTTLDRTFTATLRKNQNEGGWTYLVMDGSTELVAAPFTGLRRGYRPVLADRPRSAPPARGCRAPP